MNYTIDKARCKDDYDNMCLQPSDGGKYSAADAIRILENGNGGSMQHVKTGKGYMVNYDKSKNDWLRKKLKIK
jgi:hypothetical protein